MTWCSRCQEFYPRDCFQKNAHRPNGLQAYCRVCQCAVSQESKSRKKAAIRAQLVEFLENRR